MDSEESKFARWLARLGGETPPRPEHQRQLRQQVLDVFDRPSTDHGGRSLPSIVRNDWRWIMRRSVWRVASVAAMLLVVVGIAAWFLGGGTRVALADLIQSIVEAKTAKFKQVHETDNEPPTIIYAMVRGSRMREEYPNHQICITDFKPYRLFFLWPDKKKASLTTWINLPANPEPMDYLAKLQSDLLQLRDDPDVRRESLGTQVFDGQPAVGYRLTGKGGVIELWGNPKTGLPIRLVHYSAFHPGTKMTLSDFVFNVDLDESLFSLDPPAGYTLETDHVDGSPAQETDLLDTLRRYPELSGGTTFPDTLTLPPFQKYVGERCKKIQDTQQRTDEMFKYTRGFQFLDRLPPDANLHYAGKGVAPGTPDTPICWYRPKDSKTYRVIYADLSVRDAETPPNVPDAQPWLPAATK